MKPEKCMNCGIDRSEMKEIPWGRYIKGVSYIQCKPCRKKELENQKREFQETETDTEYESEAICPYCGNKHQRDYESTAMNEDGEHDFTCGNCGSEFTLQTDISITYSTYKK